VDWYNETAKRCHNKPDDWQWYSLSAHNVPDGFIKVMGSVPIGVYSRGPNKGRPKWARSSEADTVWMKQSDIDETKLIYSESTGKCAECQSTGQVVSRFSAQDDTQYRICKACDGTGMFKRSDSDSSVQPDLHKQICSDRIQSVKTGEAIQLQLFSEV